MGVDCADVDGNGCPDLFVTNFSEELNTLYENRGDGMFEDVTTEGRARLRLPAARLRHEAVRHRQRRRPRHPRHQRARHRQRQAVSAEPDLRAEGPALRERRRHGSGTSRAEAGPALQADARRPRAGGRRLRQRRQARRRRSRSLGRRAGPAEEPGRAGAATGSTIQREGTKSNALRPRRDGARADGGRRAGPRDQQRRQLSEQQRHPPARRPGRRETIQQIEIALAERHEADAEGRRRQPDPDDQGAMTLPHSALVVVDVQRDFCPGGALAAEGGERILPALNRHLERARAAGMPIYATRDWHPEITSHFTAFGGEWPPHCVQGTAGAEFHPGLQPAGGDDRRQQGHGSRSSRLLGLRRPYPRWRGLRGRPQGAWHRPRLLVTGIATDYCVKQTVLDARREGFEVAVLLDAITGYRCPGGRRRAGACGDERGRRQPGRERRAAGRAVDRTLTTRSARGRPPPRTTYGSARSARDASGAPRACASCHRASPARSRARTDGAARRPPARTSTQVVGVGQLEVAAAGLQRDLRQPLVGFLRHHRPPLAAAEAAPRHRAAACRRPPVPGARRYGTWLVEADRVDHHVLFLRARFITSCRLTLWVLKFIGCPRRR